MTQERKEGWGRTESREIESNGHATQSLLWKEEKAYGIKEVSSSLGWEGSTQNSRRWWVVLGAKETKQGSGSEVSTATWPLTAVALFSFNSAPFGNLFYCLHGLRLFRILHTTPPVCCPFYFSPIVSPGFLSATSGLQVASSSAGFFLFLSLPL